MEMEIEERERRDESLGNGLQERRRRKRRRKRKKKRKMRRRRKRRFGLRWWWKRQRAWGCEGRKRTKKFPSTFSGRLMPLAFVVRAIIFNPTQDIFPLEHELMLPWIAVIVQVEPDVLPIWTEVKASACW
jgi:hypothetical protein